PETTLTALILETRSNASKNIPYSSSELQRAIDSFSSVLSSSESEKLDWSALRALIAKSAHITHKEWDKTEAAGEELAALLPDVKDSCFQQLFQRVLEGGHWDSAAAAAAGRPASQKPWVVLVTGVNGIRKTSTIYEPWFREVLAEALNGQFSGDANDLPVGGNSFFRQLDYIIATAANKDFKTLYEIKDVHLYAQFKDMIFTRGRTLAEMIGVVFVKAAQRERMNVMVETSGRDIGMFTYVDHFFPDSEYNKLVINFTINDIGYAERSVDKRMLGEMDVGRSALATNADTIEVIKANAGGPYGSKVLRQVHEDSNRVWDTIHKGETEVGKSWYKARIAIEGHDEKEWVVRASGSGTKQFEFTPRTSQFKKVKIDASQ
ncbi:hypothetical protein SARC_02602, partial [Sphaeroforma arctica JP610]